MQTVIEQALMQLLAPAVAAVLWAGVLVFSLSWYLVRRRYLSIKTQYAEAQRNNAHLQQKIAEMQNELDASMHRVDNLRAELQQVRGNAVRLETRLEEQQLRSKEKAEIIERAGDAMRTQFKILAQDIFEEKGRVFRHDSNAGLQQILGPFREQLQEFKARIDDIHIRDVRDRTSIANELEQLRNANHQLNREAVNLTNALKGESRIQGNWGEMVLERVLEHSGLRKGIEFETQCSLRDENRQMFRPDVLVRLPDQRDIIIDSKVSLRAYERYCSCSDAQERASALQQHIAAVGQHISTLGAKDYASLTGVRSLDFVLMFMPIEAAFMCAVQHDAEILDLALEHKVIIVTPTTLLATMRTIENIWRYEYQNQNARAIAERAGSIYDKLRGFVADMEKIGTQISSLDQHYYTAMNKLCQGRGNLISQASRFVELGVKVKRKMPDSVTAHAEPGADLNDGDGSA